LQQTLWHSVVFTAINTPVFIWVVPLSVLDPDAGCLTSSLHYSLQTNGTTRCVTFWE